MLKFWGGRPFGRETAMVTISHLQIGMILQVPLLTLKSAEKNVENPLGFRCQLASTWPKHLEVQNWRRRKRQKRWSRWWFQIWFYFLPRKLGKWSNLTNMFQMSWNHQLVMSFCVQKDVYWKNNCWLRKVWQILSIPLQKSPQKNTWFI